MKKIISILLLYLLISCIESKKEIIATSNEPEKIIDIKSIIGKTKDEVEKILGAAESIEPFSESTTICINQPCEKATYQNDKYEIIFINSKSDWITINDLSAFDLTPENIQLLALPMVEPEFNNPKDLIRWKNIENIKEINFFNNGSNKIYYIYIHANTE